MTRMSKNVCEDEATAPTTRCSRPIFSSSVEREFDLERRTVTRVNIGEGFVFCTCPECTDVRGLSQESNLEQHVRAVHLGARLGSCLYFWVDASGNLYECAHTYSDPSNLNLTRHRSLMYGFEAEIRVPTLVGTMVYPEHLLFTGANLACPLMTQAPLEAVPVVDVRHAFDLSSVPLLSPSPAILTHASGTLATTALAGIQSNPEPNAQAAAVDRSRWTFTGGSPITTDLHFTFSASAASSFSHEPISFFPPPRNGNCDGSPNRCGGAPNHNCNTLVAPVLGTRASSAGTVEQANRLINADAGPAAPAPGMGMGMDAGSWSDSESSLSDSEWVEMFMAIAPREVLREYYASV